MKVFSCIFLLLTVVFSSLETKVAAQQTDIQNISNLGSLAYNHYPLKVLNLSNIPTNNTIQQIKSVTASYHQHSWLIITFLLLFIAALTLYTYWPSPRHRKYLMLIASIMIFSVIIFFSIELSQIQKIERQKQQVLAKLSTTRIQLEESLNRTVFLGQELTEYIRRNPGLNQSEFEQVSQQLINNHPFIHHITAAPNFIIKLVYPFSENKHLLNTDYRQLPDHWPYALKAKESNQNVLVGPIYLEGAHDNDTKKNDYLISQLPVYYRDNSGQTRFWGLVSTAIDLNKLYRFVGLYSNNQNLEYAIRGKNGMGDRGKTFFGDAALFHDDHSIILSTIIPGGFWQIAAQLTDSKKISSIPVVSIFLLGILSTLLVIFSLFQLRNDETKLQNKKSNISYLAYHDSLTGLPNRARFIEELGRVQAHAKRSGNSIAVLMLDLDHFKQINDTLGHAAGDELLIKVARRIKKRTRKEDHIARLGGDEFAIIQRDLKTSDDAATFAQELIISLSKPYSIKHTPFHTSASIGIAIWHSGEKINTNLLEEADIALYKAKDQERGSYAFHTSEMTREIQYRVDLRNELEKALNTNSLFLVFQPQINIKNHSLIGVEALLRWKHPVHGDIPPAEFIPIAETHGMMHRLGFYVIKLACATLIRWRKKGLFNKVMSINISPGQLNNEVFDKEVIKLINDAGLPAEALELEVTERIMTQPRTSNGQIINALAAEGIKLTMDDFGTGHSSLLTLNHWPLHRLKIAQEFVRDMLTNSKNREIVGATIGLAENLGLEVMAEGVEKKEQMTFLEKKGCYLIQGHLLAPPMQEKKLLKWLHDNYPNRLITPFKPT